MKKTVEKASELLRYLSGQKIGIHAGSTLYQRPRLGSA